MTPIETRPMSVEEFKDIADRHQQFEDCIEFGIFDHLQAERLINIDMLRLMETVAHLQTVVADLTDQVRGVDTRKHITDYRPREDDFDEDNQFDGLQA